MNTDHCLVERDGPILVVTLNRPEAKNALSPGMLLGMYRAWRLLDSDDELRVAILTGRGDVFCAGADLRAMGSDQVDDEFQKHMKQVPDLHWQALLRHNRPMKPIIAAVEGFAVAGGTEILQRTPVGSPRRGPRRSKARGPGGLRDSTSLDQSPDENAARSRREFQ